MTTEFRLARLLSVETVNDEMKAKPMTVTVKPIPDLSKSKQPDGPQVVTTDPGSQKPTFQYAPKHPSSPVVVNPQHPLQEIRGDAHGAHGGPEVQAPLVDNSQLDTSPHAGPTKEPHVQRQNLRQR